MSIQFGYAAWIIRQSYLGFHHPSHPFSHSLFIQSLLLLQPLSFSYSFPRYLTSISFYEQRYTPDSRQSRSSFRKVYYIRLFSKFSSYILCTIFFTISMKYLQKLCQLILRTGALKYINTIRYHRPVFDESSKKAWIKQNFTEHLDD